MNILNPRCLALGVVVGVFCAGNVVLATEVTHILSSNFCEGIHVAPTTISVNGNSFTNTAINCFPGAATGIPAQPISNGGSWTFSESGMVGTSTNFDDNSHRFYFSGNGTDRLKVNGDMAWRVAFDVKLDATFSNPRKVFKFGVMDAGSQPNSQLNSWVNLTTNRSPVTNGASSTPGESAMFNGEYNFLRLIGPDGADETPPMVPPDPLATNLNKNIGYATGDTIHMEIIHIPSPDPYGSVVLPSTVELIYDDPDDGLPAYTTGPRSLRRAGKFSSFNTATPNIIPTLAFELQGIAHSTNGTDSYGVTVSNFFSVIDLPGDYNLDGVVNAADYTVWRDTMGSTTNMRANGDNSGASQGVIDLADYNLWRTNFGNHVGAAAFASAVPEPSALALVLLACAVAMRRRG